LAKATGLVQGSTADPGSIRAALTYLLGLSVVIEAFERLLLPGASVEIVARSFNFPSSSIGVMLHGKRIERVLPNLRG